MVLKWFELVEAALDEIAGLIRFEGALLHRTYRQENAFGFVPFESKAGAWVTSPRWPGVRIRRTALAIDGNWILMVNPFRELPKAWF